MTKLVKQCNKKETKSAREYAHLLIKALSIEMKIIDSKMRYNVRRVGSAGTNTIVFDTDGSFDLDYQMVLVEKVDTKSPTAIRNSFSTGLKRAYIFEMCCKLESKENINIEDSTSVITVSVFENYEKKKLKFSIDFAIVGYNNLKKYNQNELGESSIIRRNSEGDNQQKFTWNQLPSKHNQAYIDYKSLAHENKIIVRDNVVQQKIQLKSKNEKFKSFGIFIDEVNKIMKMT